jgi:hypothetical protein
VPEDLRGLDRLDARKRVVGPDHPRGPRRHGPRLDPRLGRASAASAPPQGRRQVGDPATATRRAAPAPRLCSSRWSSPSPSCSPSATARTWSSSPC